MFLPIDEFNLSIFEKSLFIKHEILILKRAEKKTKQKRKREGITSIIKVFY